MWCEDDFATFGRCTIECEADFHDVAGFEGAGFDRYVSDIKVK